MSRFSGRQITVMVVAACAAVVLAPTAVIAATSLVTIADGTTHSQARVDAGALRVGGTVNAPPAAPISPFHKGLFYSSGPMLVYSATGPARLSITSVVGRNSATRPDFVELQTWSRPTGVTTACTAHVESAGWQFVAAEHLLVPGNGGQQLTFPSGWVISAGRGVPYCVVATLTIGDTSGNLWLDIDGFKS